MEAIETEEAEGMPIMTADLNEEQVDFDAVPGDTQRS